ncbi:wyosine base formation domain-containing protein [Janibacter sp. Soil728]|uniref:TIGR03084 family metal-binding protein n=1 Tax=Janibacter sp. Soil728 TaxID=1736393 RepID=UPI0006F5F87E|nr:TIGR03084 family metal-binding protein [Janibacter sp. Soil728]KRE38320.1 wyosine base formation domain-containing protein [Janibacter sp. Soil728]
MSDTVAAFLDECTDLDALVAPLDASDWSRPTPAQGWTIAHQIAHLAWTDEVSLLAATAPEEFAREVEAALANVTGHVDEQAAKGAAAPPAELLIRWRTGRQELADALRAVPDGTRLPWFGPPMSARSMATARLMETWAHGQDVADALEVPREPTDRLHGICHLGVRTRDFAYIINNLPVPAAPFRVELTAPSGEVWTWGDGSTTDSLTGSAEDFALVVTQRREVAATDLVATGEAGHWLTFAQAFAGPPPKRADGTPS